MGAKIYSIKFNPNVHTYVLSKTALRSRVCNNNVARRRRNDNCGKKQTFRYSTQGAWGGKILSSRKGIKAWLLREKRRITFQNSTPAPCELPAPPPQPLLKPTHGEELSDQTNMMRVPQTSFFFFPLAPTLGGEAEEEQDWTLCSGSSFFSFLVSYPVAHDP